MKNTSALHVAKQLEHVRERIDILESIRELEGLSTVKRDQLRVLYGKERRLMSDLNNHEREVQQ